MYMYVHAYNNYCSYPINGKQLSHLCVIHYIYDLFCLKSTNIQVKFNVYNVMQKPKVGNTLLLREKARGKKRETCCSVQHFTCVGVAEFWVGAWQSCLYRWLGVVVCCLRWAGQGHGCLGVASDAPRPPVTATPSSLAAGWSGTHLHAHVHQVTHTHMHTHTHAQVNWYLFTFSGGVAVWKALVFPKTHEAPPSHRPVPVALNDAAIVLPRLLVPLQVAGKKQSHLTLG